MERGRECDVTIRFDLSRVKLDQVFALEKILAEMGIHFDRGSGFGGRDWEFDFSLSGPVRVLFKGDRYENAVERMKQRGKRLPETEPVFDATKCGAPDCGTCPEQVCPRFLETINSGFGACRCSNSRQSEAG